MTIPVLAWCEFFWPTRGGVEVFLERLLPALERRGYTFHVIASHTAERVPDEDRLGNVTISRFPFWEAIQQRDPVAMASIGARVRRRVAEIAPALIHRHNVGPSDFFLLDALRHWPASLAVSVQREELGHEPEGLTARVLSEARWVLGVSPRVVERVRTLVPGLEARSSVVYNAVEEPTLTPAPLPWDPPVLACIGRLDAQKGFDIALAAFAILAPRFPTVKLLIAGEGREREALERQCTALGIAGRVTFVGWVPREEMFPFLNRATIVLMPSRHEGFGLVALEAAHMARPLIGARVAGVEDIVRDGVTGMLVPPEDAEALAAATATLLANRSGAEAMGQAARDDARRFGLDECVAQHDAIYRRLLRERPA